LSPTGLAGLRHVRQRGAVQRLEVARQRVVEEVLQPAARRERAGVGGGVETLHQPEVGLSGAHHIADADGLGLGQQPQATAAAPGGFEQSLAGQVVDDLHQVVLRQPVVLGQFADRHQAVPVRRAVHQHPQGVVGVFGQAHGNP
jgi:hypothetical protein